MIDGKVKGYFLLGQNPAVGSAHGRAQRLGMANLDWLVVRDLFEIESATFWKNSPEIETGEIVPEECRTEVFLLPAASHAEKEGTFTQTQRMLQWREKAVEPPGDCRSELWFFYHLGRMVRERLAGSTDADATARCSTSPGTTRPTASTPSPSAEDVLKEINGYEVATGRPLSTFTEMKDDGSTARRLLDLHRRLRGRRQPGRPAQARQRAGLGRRPSGAGPGRPTGASSTTAPRPTPRAGRGASARPTSGGTPTGRGRRVDRARRPGLREDQAAVVPARPGATTAWRRIAGDDPFIMQGDGKGCALRARRA